MVDNEGKSRGLGRGRTVNSVNVNEDEEEAGSCDSRQRRSLKSGWKKEIR